MGLWDRIKERDRQIEEARARPPEPRQPGQISYVKIFLAVLLAGWVLYALIKAGA